MPSIETGAAEESFSPESLARDFGARSALAQEGVRALYEAVVRADHPKARARFARWKALFSEACGRDVEGPSETAAKLAAFYGLEVRVPRAAEPLFALHTFYALFVKLLALRAAAFFHGLPSPLRAMAQAAGSEGLRARMEEFEAGDTFRRLSVAHFLEGDPFDWYTAAWSGPVEALARAMAARLDGYDPATLAEGPAGSRDLLKTLYQQLFPNSVRRGLGEYYTPDWLAAHVLDELGYAGDPDERLLDPACGSGTFLVMAVNRVRVWHAEHGGASRLSRRDLCRKILANVIGFDLNPLAVMAARTNYLIALRGLIGPGDTLEIPVHLCDSILGPCAGPFAPLSAGPMDYVAGNPPWIAWDNLPADARNATKALWERYGLFTLRGAAARHGGAKKDLAMLMLYASADRYLKPDGKLGFVITQTLFQTKGAGEGFRRFRIGAGGEWLGVLRVDDLADFQPFDGASNWTSTIVLQKGRPTVYPVPYYKWSLARDRSRPSENGPGTRAAAERPSGLRADLFDAAPIDPDKPGSPWLIRPRSLRADLAAIVGPADYTAHSGACTGGANGVYWLRIVGKAPGGVLVRNMAETSKRPVPAVERTIEPDLLYPLVRWSDVARYRASPSCHLLMAQDPETRTGIDEPAMRSRYPRTYAYLAEFRERLVARAAYKTYQGRGAFYSMYDVGAYTLAPVKVVWRRMDRRISAAVVCAVDDPHLGKRPVIPQETCVLVECSSPAEAYYLCALLNSAVADFVVQSHSVRGGKGFGTPSMLDYVRLARFRPDDPAHAELAGLGRKAHGAAHRGEDLTEVQQAIDRSAAALFGWTAGDLAAVAGAGR